MFLFIRFHRFRQLSSPCSISLRQRDLLWFVKCWQLYGSAFSITRLQSALEQICSGKFFLQGFVLHCWGVSVIMQQNSCADVAPRGKYSVPCSCDSLEHKTHLLQEGPSFAIGWKPSSVISAVVILVSASF